MQFWDYKSRTFSYFSTKFKLQIKFLVQSQTTSRIPAELFARDYWFSSSCLLVVETKVQCNTKETAEKVQHFK